MEVSFAPSFLRSLRSLPKALKDEIIEKVDLLAGEQSDQRLKVHKLGGRLRGCYSFSVNYQIRILFEYVGKPRRAYLVAVGDHDVYDR